MLCDLYARALKVPSVGVDDDFFALGGDSIVAVQLLILARREGLELTPRDVFRHRTVAELATVARTGRTDLVEETRWHTLSDDELAAVQGDFPVAVEEALPLGPLQEGFFFHALVDGAELDAYVVQQVVELSGPVDGTLLREAAQRLVDRHAPLRACFRRTPDGRPSSSSPPVSNCPGVRSTWQQRATPRLAASSPRRSPPRNAPAVSTSPTRR